MNPPLVFRNLSSAEARNPWNPLESLGILPGGFQEQPEEFFPVAAQAKGNLGPYCISSRSAP